MAFDKVIAISVQKYTKSRYPPTVEMMMTVYIIMTISIILLFDTMNVNLYTTVDRPDNYHIYAKENFIVCRLSFTAFTQSIPGLSSLEMFERTDVFR